MEFYDVVNRRRMVRNYTEEPVVGEALERIIGAARRAPSAGFSQGQHLVVVTDAGERAEIARLCDEEAYVSQGFDPWISRAPVHVVVCVRPETYLERYREPDKGGPDGAAGKAENWPVPYWWVDAGATMMLILLAAEAEGLAAGFLGSHAMPDLKGHLGIPEDVAPIGVVTIGHPAPDRRSGSLARGWKPDAEAIHRGSW